jgi:hypothetical protein
MRFPASILGLFAIVGAGCSERDGGPQILSLAECADLGGTPSVDPGDGSAFDEGCGEAGILLGYLDEEEVGGEGGICCE